jgi:hypothetical protein
VRAGVAWGVAGVHTRPPRAWLCVRCGRRITRVRSHVHRSCRVVAVHRRGPWHHRRRLLPYSDGTVANRVVRLGAGRQRMALERGRNPKRSRRACTCEYGLQSCRGESAGVTRLPRELISHSKSLPSRFATFFCIAVQHRVRARPPDPTAELQRGRGTHGSRKYANIISRAFDSLAKEDFTVSLAQLRAEPIHATDTPESYP